VTNQEDELRLRASSSLWQRDLSHLPLNGRQSRTDGNLQALTGKNQVRVTDD